MPVVRRWAPLARRDGRAIDGAGRTGPRHGARQLADRGPSPSDLATGSSSPFHRRVWRGPQTGGRLAPEALAALRRNTHRRSSSESRRPCAAPCGHLPPGRPERNAGDRNGRSGTRIEPDRDGQRQAGLRPRLAGLRPRRIRRRLTRDLAGTRPRVECPRPDDRASHRSGPATAVPLAKRNV